MAISIIQIRKAFQQQYSISINSGEFDQSDIDRLLTDDTLCQCFISRACVEQSFSLETCLNLIESAFKWRHRDQINSLNETSLAVIGGERAGSAVYLAGRDKRQSPVLLIRASDYPRNLSPDQLTAARQHLAWLLDSRHRLSPSDPVTLLLDMSDCSSVAPSGFNVEFFSFLAHACDFYYPNFMARLLVYEMPSLFSASWQIFLAGLDGSTQSKLDLVYRSTIGNFIDVSYLPDRLSLLPKLDSNSSATHTTTSNNKKLRLRKSVSFSYAESATNSSTGMRARSGIMKKSHQGSNNENSTESLAEFEAVEIAAENSFVGRYLTVCPADRLDFPIPTETSAVNLNASANQMMCSRCCVRLINSSSSRWVAYKIRTTAPSDYRVKPSCSILPPNSCASIIVVYRRTSNNTTDSSSKPSSLRRKADRDRLQIIAAPFEAPSVKIDEFISRESADACIIAAQPDQLMDHRLLCRLVPTIDSGSSRQLTSISAKTFSKEADKLAAEVAELNQTVNRLSLGEVIQLKSTDAISSIGISIRFVLLYLCLLLAAFVSGWTYST